MLCQIGQDIYRLRRKNRELLQQLESNSVLLENRIKRLRRAARTPLKSDESWEELPPSPLKRRYKSWKSRNSSKQVISSLNLKESNDTQGSSDSELSTLDSATEGIVMRDVKKSQAKRVKRNTVVCKPRKSTQSVPSSGKVKGRLSVSGKKCVIQKRQECHCSVTPEKNTPRPLTKVKDTLKIKNKMYDGNENTEFDGDIENTEFPERFTKNLEEACCALTYSPESVFLRRMKQRLEKWKKLSKVSNGKENVKSVQICNCSKNESSENDDISFESSESHEFEKSPGGTGDCVDVKKTLSSKSCTKCLGKPGSVVRSRKKKGSRRSSDSSLGSVKVIVSKHPRQAHYEEQGGGDSSKGQKVKTTGSGDLSTERCLCKKEVGGPCCCQSNHKVSTSHYPRPQGSSILPKKTKSLPVTTAQSNQNGRKVLKPRTAPSHCDRVAAAPKAKPASSLKSSVSSRKASTSSASRTKPDAGEDVREERATRRDQEEGPADVRAAPSRASAAVHQACPVWSSQCAGYDVVAGLVENEHARCSAESCAPRLEELRRFRQKHWFDCHAHPHTVCEHCGGGDSARKAEDDLQTPREACTRTYMLNERLFPEQLSEAHMKSCCTRCCQALPSSSRSASSVAQPSTQLPPPLPVKIRNEVTLPVLTPRYTDMPPTTAKYPPGVQVFPKSKIVVRDVQASQSVPVVRTLRDTPNRLARRVGMPVPSNSLALRFQKGVA